MEKDFFEISREILVLIGLCGIWWYIIDLIKETRDYMKQKNYNLKNKKVCDVCFEDLKNTLKHIKGIDE